MVYTPDVLAAEFVAAGCSRLIVHAEACTHLHRTLGNIASLGATAAVALNPATPASAVEHVLDLVDMVLVMTVNPGFGGQAYIATMERKIAEVRAMIDGRGLADVVDLEVDGGIGPSTIAGRRARGRQRADRRLGPVQRPRRPRARRQRPPRQGRSRPSHRSPPGRATAAWHELPERSTIAPTASATPLRYRRPRESHRHTGHGRHRARGARPKPCWRPSEGDRCGRSRCSCPPTPPGSWRAAGSGATSASPRSTSSPSTASPSGSPGPRSGPSERLPVSTAVVDLAVRGVLADAPHRVRRGGRPPVHRGRPARPPPRAAHGRPCRARSGSSGRRAGAATPARCRASPASGWPARWYDEGDLLQRAIQRHPRRSPARAAHPRRRCSSRSRSASSICSSLRALGEQGDVHVLLGLTGERRADRDLVAAATALTDAARQRPIQCALRADATVVSVTDADEEVRARGARRRRRRPHRHAARPHGDRVAHRPAVRATGRAPPRRRRASTGTAGRAPT